MQRTDLAGLIDSLGPAAFYEKTRDLLTAGTLTPDDFSLRRLAEACGIFGSPSFGGPGDRGVSDGLAALREAAAGPDRAPVALLSEHAPGARTDLFRVVTAELLARKVAEGYDAAAGLIGDALVTVVKATGRGAKIAGFTATASPTTIPEGHKYEESTFAEKFVTSEESKQGRILSVTEELIAFDQTGEVFRRAVRLGEGLRQERERTIVRAVADAEPGKPVYRPGGVGETLYAADGSNRNLIGPANTTSPTHASALPLDDWAALDAARGYRATEVLDDRVDGQRRPILAPATQVLVPESLAGTARGIVEATEIRRTVDGTTTVSGNPHRRLEVLSSPFLDELGAEGRRDWYLGDFRKQFVWTEVWPVQTFLQRSDGPAAFERDVALRVKARYFGGVSATDTAFVTKVLGG
ncbi:phage major capsid protein [Alienimonas californiensis]|uniref:Phage capsid family protein n=1 Tax=Alienimonas californiensis TaxID=2527989 RepID=A0A517P6X8_9PLAN|nr:hypothetical protein [Alienimonas californiensis]QDT15130.1 hypothetical protein CA12_12110 [Alienimonas californiensis]